MELNYKNCVATISELEEGGVTAVIDFGGAKIYSGLEYETTGMATVSVKKLIDQFVGDLPPALSYKL